MKFNVSILLARGLFWQFCVNFANNFIREYFAIFLTNTHETQRNTCYVWKFLLEYLHVLLLKTTFIFVQMPASKVVIARLAKFSTTRDQFALNPVTAHVITTAIPIFLVKQPNKTAIYGKTHLLLYFVWHEATFSSAENLSEGLLDIKTYIFLVGCGGLLWQ